MQPDGWPWVIAGIAVLIVLPVLIEWMRRRPPRSPQRLMGWAGILAVGVVTTVAVLALTGVSWTWLLVALAVGDFLAALPMGLGWAWLRAIRRGEEERRYAPENLVLGPARLWVRPRRASDVAPRGLSGRVDRWLATDGPVPTAGWWHNGGLILDDRGPALVDAAGLRHELPPTTAALIRLAAPKSVLLVDDEQALLARLPTTGFDDRDLREFCVAAGWRYGDAFGSGRTARYAMDLRAVVADHAARDQRPLLLRVFSRRR
ncbi:MAG TPA: hypothetical protein VGD84_18795 [Pseudonocardiaceae bacterium]